MSGSNIIIAGGSGFLGRSLADALLSRGDRVTILGRAASPTPAIPHGAEWRQWDAKTLRGNWANCFDGATAIVNRDLGKFRFVERLLPIHADDQSIKHHDANPKESLMALTSPQLVELWDENWSKGGGYPPWSRALQGLTAEQAAWKPQPQRYSIWEIALHLIFWREVMARRARGEQVSAEERKRRNHESPPSGNITEEAWHDVRQRFAASQQQVRGAILIAEELDDFLHLAFHDTYHVGQIMYIRAMQGLPPIV